MKGKTEQRSFQITAKLISRACDGNVRAREWPRGGGGCGEPITGDTISRGYLQLMYTRKPLSPTKLYLQIVNKSIRVAANKKLRAKDVSQKNKKPTAENR